jgi:hypothetical protein
MTKYNINTSMLTCYLIDNIFNASQYIQYTFLNLGIEYVLNAAYVYHAYPIFVSRLGLKNDHMNLIYFFIVQTSFY